MAEKTFKITVRDDMDNPTDFNVAGLEGYLADALRDVDATLLKMEEVQ